MASESTSSIPTAARTRVGTGAAVLDRVDGRSAGARRYRELVADLAAHVGAPTATQDAIIRRAAGLIVWCEAQEAAQANGAEIDIAAFTTAANSLRRLLADLGYAPRTRDVTPTLQDYLAARAEAGEDAA